MRRVTILVCAFALTFAAAAPAPAQEPPNTKKSEKVSHLGFLPEPQVISARFKGTLMYVSTLRGLAIYDVKDAKAPKKLGELRLPHFENEDIDVGNGIALISNDPSEGAGVLFVIDVKDPTKPAVIGQMPTGTADAGIFSQFFGTPTGTGTGHTASCVQDCKFAYLAGTLQGIAVVDLRNPAAPKYADLDPIEPGVQAVFAAEEATGAASHDVQFDQAGRAWIVGHHGTAAYDVTNPLKPILVARTNIEAQSKGDGVSPNDGKSYNDFIHHNSMRLRNSALATLPATADPAADSQVVAITEEDYNRPTCEGAGSFETWEISRSETRRGGLEEKGAPVPVLKPLDKWDVEVDPSRQTLCSAHYFDERGGLIAQGWYEQGVRFLDVSNPRDIRQVGFYIPQKNVMWGALWVPTDPTGEIVYALDNVRGIDVLRFDRPDPVVAQPGGGGPGGGSASDNAKLPSVVAPPADGSGVTKQDVPGRARSGQRPDLALRIANGRSTARRGQRLRWRVDVTHVGGASADDVAVRLDLPRAVTRVRAPGASLRGRRLTFPVGSLAVGQKRSFIVAATVRRRARARAVLLLGRLFSRDDVNVRDNEASDRDRLARSSRSSKSRGRARAASIASLAGTERAQVSASERSRAEADYRLAQRAGAMRSSRKPVVSGRALRSAGGAFGFVCRAL